MGFIATNTISQGDTRSSSLRWICENDGKIYCALRRRPWPGLAAVVISVVHISKGYKPTRLLLDRRPANEITAYLLPMGTSADPEKLPENKLKAFQGTTLLGMGFTFEDTATSDLVTPGTPSPLKRMEEIIEANPRCSSLIKKYIGGEELNSRPIQDHRRYCIDFGDRDLDSCATAFPDLLEIVTLKVKPERRASAARSNSSHANRCRIYWQHYHRAKELYSSISCLDSVVAVSMVGGELAFAIISADQVYANTLIVFSLNPKPSFALLQSRVHETWARVFASSMKDDLRYSTSDCFEAYPLPRLSSLHNTEVEINSAHPAKLSVIGELYHQFRAELMVRNNEGLTSTYNRFHDPAESSDGLLQLRALHQEMDEGVLEAYGWSDALTQAITDNPHHTPCGFGLDYLDTRKKTPSSPRSCRSGSTQETCSSGMPERLLISRASCVHPVLSRPKSASPGATAGPMPSEMTYWPGFWR